jgi:hypothetical protein
MFFLRFLKYNIINIKKKMRKKIFIALVMEKKKETSKLLKTRFSKMRFLFQITCTDKCFATINQIIFRIVITIVFKIFFYLK